MVTQYVGSNYLLLDVIGFGATGQVWSARTRDGGKVAVKVLRSELAEDEKVVSRFVQERSLLRKLDPPISCGCGTWWWRVPCWPS